MAVDCTDRLVSLVSFCITPALGIGLTILRSCCTGTWYESHTHDLSFSLFSSLQNKQGTYCYTERSMSAYICK